jgi:hypothetical protein
MIILITDSPEKEKQFLKNHPGLSGRLKIKTVTNSFFEVINEIITNSDERFACIFQDDVMLSSDYEARVNELVQDMDKHWPNWGIVGNAGISAIQVGLSSQNLIRYVHDRNGGPNLTGQIMPVYTISNCVILLNITALKARNIRLPHHTSHGLYEVALAVETLAAGLGVFVAPHLACWRGGDSEWRGFKEAENNEELQAYLFSKLQNSKLKTTVGELSIFPQSAVMSRRGIVDVEMQSLQNAKPNRSPKKIAIVIRTQLKRPTLLQRTLESARAFIAAFGSDSSQCEVFVVSDAPQDSAPQLGQDVQFLHVLVEPGVDSRFLLIKAACERIEADYFWFIDDDDWLFPNEARRLALALASSPDQSLLILSSRYFHEQGHVDNKVTESPRVVPGRYFAGDKFIFCLTGENHIPFCGAIFPRTVLVTINRRAYETITYLEDYFLLQLALLTISAPPIVIEKLFAGISIRETGNTVTEKDRTKWNRSMAEMISHVVADQYQRSPLLSLKSILDERQLTDYPHTFSFFIKRILRKFRRLTLSKIILSVRRFIRM